MIEAKIIRITDRLESSIQVKQQILKDEALLKKIETTTDLMINCLKHQNGTLFFAGNGGSAADAQHLAAELVSRFYYDRPGLSAEALNTNTSSMTAIGNDYSYDQIFAKQIEARAKTGDVLIGLTTSGNSKNIIEAFQLCQSKGVKTVAMTGETGGTAKNCADILLNMPSQDTPRIQEAHICVGHIICELIEAEIFPQ